MARPLSGSEPLNEKISFRASRTERLALKKLARAQGEGPYLRGLIMRELRAERNRTS